jgi:hypothetical protein
MRMLPMIRALGAAVLLLVGFGEVQAQCADLMPPPPVPEPDADCKDNLLAKAGLTKSCADKHAEAVEVWEEQYRNFGATIGGAFTMVEQPAASRTHRVRGCKGETVGIEVEGGTLNGFAYQLRSPSGIVLSQAELNPRRGSIVTGRYVTLPETGTYTILTTLRSGESSRNTEGKPIYLFRYSIRFPGGGLEPLALGATTTGTLDAQGVYARRIEVPSGRKVRVAVSVQGEAASRLVISEDDGTPIVDEALAGRRVVETLSAGIDERTFLIRVEGSGGTVGRGVEIRTEEIEEIQREITLEQLMIDSFPGLPPTFDARTARDAERMEEFLRTYRFTVQGTGRVYGTITVAEAAALRVQFRMFGEHSQRMVVRDTIVGRETTIPVLLELEEPFIIEVRPVGARMGPRSRPVISLRFTADDPRTANASPGRPTARPRP